MKIYTPNPKYDGRSKDLTGLKVGAVTVLKLSGSSGDGRLWECLCECGNLCIKNTGHLRQEVHNVSCGCKRYERAKIIDGKRTCTKCGELKLLRWFVTENNKFSGHGSVCLVCHRKQCNAIARRNYKKNRAVLLEKAKAYAAANPDRMKNWRLTPKGSTSSARHYQKNKQYYRAATIKRRAMLAGVTTDGVELIVNWEREWKLKDLVVCYWCLKPFAPDQCEVDHIIAVSAGGPHTISNLCISCMPCNRSKNDQSIAEWNSKIEQPILI